MATKVNSSKTATKKRKPIAIPRTPDLDKSGKKTAKRVASNNLYPSQLFEVRGGIPQMSDAERDEKIQAIQAQTNSIKVAQQNHILDREIEVSEGLAIETQIQTAKNLVTGEQLNTESINLEIAQEKTSIQVEKLEGYSIKLDIERTKNQISSTQLEYNQIDLKGEQGVLPYRQQLWDIKLENLAIDVQAARQVLDTKINQLGARLNGGVQ